MVCNSVRLDIDNTVVVLLNESIVDNSVSLSSELLEGKMCGARMTDSPSLLTCCRKAGDVGEAGLIYPPPVRCQ